MPRALDTWEQRIQPKVKKKLVRSLKHLILFNLKRDSFLQWGLQLLLQVKAAEEKTFYTLNEHNA